MLNVKQSLLRSIQAHNVPEGWQSHISWHEGCKFVSPTHRPPLRPRGEFLVLIRVRGSYWDRTDYVNEKFQWHHRESNHPTSVCSAVPQPTVPPGAPKNCINVVKCFVLI
jgi:hypothetical protein